MAVRVVDIGVPVAARHVAADPLDAHLMVGEIGVSVGDLLEAAALPGDLVDRDLGRELAVGAVVHQFFREQHHRVVVGAVAHEITLRPEIPVLREPWRAREIGEVGDLEAEQVAVELATLLELVEVETEMPEPADLERPVEQKAADIVALTVCRHRNLPRTAERHAPRSSSTGSVGETPSRSGYLKCGMTSWM